MKKTIIALSFAASLGWMCPTLFADIDPLPPGVLSGLTLREYIVKSVMSIDPPAVEDELAKRAMSHEAYLILCDLLSEKKMVENTFCVVQIVEHIMEIEDGRDFLTPSEKLKALELTRRAVASKGVAFLEVFRYLASRGDESDIALLENTQVIGAQYYSDLAQREINGLRARVLTNTVETLKVEADVPVPTPTTNVIENTAQNVSLKTPPPEKPTEQPVGKAILWLAIVALAVIVGMVVWKQIKRKR